MQGAPVLRLAMLYRVLLFPIAHWRGEVALWPTLGLTLVGLRLLVAGFGGLGFFALDAGLFLWQVVGAWRALSRHQRDTPDFLGAIAGYTAIAICIPALVWPQLDSIAQKAAPQIKPEIPLDTGVTLRPGIVLLSGDMDYVMFDAFEAALADHSDLRAVVLDSHGGRVFAARAIARLIGENALDTHVDSICASACTLVFVAGQTRSLGPNGRLGFHGYANQSRVQIVNTSDEEARDRAAFLAHGISPEFVGKMFQAAPQDMWFPSPQELQAAGMVTAR